MSEHQMIDAMWDDSPVDVSAETSMIWSIANKLRGPYQRACEKTKSFFTRPFYFRESVAISVEIEHNPPYPIR